ncbi:MAG: hypothetical protein WCO03_02500 [bacterium]
MKKAMMFLVAMMVSLLASTVLAEKTTATQEKLLKSAVVLMARQLSDNLTDVDDAAEKTFPVDYHRELDGVGGGLQWERLTEIMSALATSEGKKWVGKIEPFENLVPEGTKEVSTLLTGKYWITVGHDRAAIKVQHRAGNNFVNRQTLEEFAKELRCELLDDTKIIGEHVRNQRAETVVVYFPPKGESPTIYEIDPLCRPKTYTRSDVSQNDVFWPSWPVFYVFIK